MSQTVDLTDFRTAYVLEAEELLGIASASLLAIEAALREGKSHGRQVRELFRCIHTIKGLSSMVGIEPVVVLTHRMETSLRLADRAGGGLSVASVDALLAGVRAVGHRVRALADGKAVPEAPAALLERLDRVDTIQPKLSADRGQSFALDATLAAKLLPEDVKILLQGAAEGRRALRADFTPSREQAEAGLTITLVRARVGEIAEIVKVIPISVPKSEGVQGGLVFALLLLTTAQDEQIAEAMGIPTSEVRSVIAARDVEAAGEERPSDPTDPDLPDVDAQRQGVVRVSVERLDDAMEQLSALVVSRFRLTHAVAALAERGADVRELRLILHDNSRQLRDLRASILRVRMVRVAEVFERIPLLVRGLTRATGKRVNLQIDAGNAELDKSVAERIFPALVHLVRNAVDHAIETPEERKRAGKPEEGSLSIACFERSNSQLEISVTDDGRGVDRRKVAERAGRPVPETDAALLDMLYLRGLSTREQATTTSGRGMGMDIVKRVLDQLGGELLMQTREGKGTRFVLHVPLTISIVDAFSFICAGRRFVVPVTMVEEVLEVDPAALVHAPSRSGRRILAPRMLERRGEAVPFVELATVLGLGGHPSGLRKALLVRRNHEPIAFGVDRMLGQQEVVVRPLEDPLVHVPGVAGATDLGDGQPTLVLDLPALGASLSSAPALESVA